MDIFELVEQFSDLGRICTDFVEEVKWAAEEELVEPVTRKLGTYSKTQVLPIEGCIVKTKLLFEWHSGVYVGANEIVELAGNGSIRVVTPEEFNTGGLRMGTDIYIACDQNRNVLYDWIIASRARSQLCETRDYNFALDNCHQFTSGCITGDFEGADNCEWFLRSTIENELNSGEGIKWVPWEN